MAELVKAVLVMTQPTPDESHGHVYIKYSTSQRVGFVIHATGKEGDRVVLEWFNFAPGVNHPLLGIPGTGLVLGFYMMNISPSHIPGQLLQMAIQTMAVQPPDLGRSQGICFGSHEWALHFINMMIENRFLNHNVWQKAIDFLGVSSTNTQRRQAISNASGDSQVNLS